MGSGTDEYKCNELDVSPKARHWFEGEMSKLIMLQPSRPECTYNYGKYFFQKTQKSCVVFSII